MVPQKVADLLLSVFFLLQFLATLKHFREVVYHAVNLTVTCLCVGQLCFSGFDPVQRNLSIWQGVSRAYLLGWQLCQQLAGTTKLHPAAVGTTGT